MFTYKVCSKYSDLIYQTTFNNISKGMNYRRIKTPDCFDHITLNNRLTPANPKALPQMVTL